MNAHKAERGTEHEAGGCALALVFAGRLLQLQEDDDEGCGFAAQMPMAPQFAARGHTLSAVYSEIFQVICRNAE